MSGYGYTRQAVLHDGSSAQSSTVTSNPLFVGDSTAISISVQSVAAVASNWTLQAANADGFGATIAEGEWSTLSVIAAAGIYSLTPGARFVRLLRPATNSQASVVVAYRST